MCYLWEVHILNSFYTYLLLFGVVVQSGSLCTAVHVVHCTTPRGTIHCTFLSVAPFEFVHHIRGKWYNSDTIERTLSIRGMQFLTWLGQCGPIILIKIVKNKSIISSGWSPCITNGCYTLVPIFSFCLQSYLQEVCTENNSNWHFLNNSFEL